MAEKVFDTIQLGRDAGTPYSEVAATTVYPGKSTGPDLDRGYLNPDEDYGIISDSYPGRGSWGIRGGSTSIDSVARFEDVGHLFNMNVAPYPAPGGGANAYTFDWTAAESSEAISTYTVEMGSEDALDQYTLTGCVVPELTLGFDALTAPGNSPWNVTASVEALTRLQKAITAGQAAPSGMETIEGHFSRLYAGTTATAYTSLGELPGSLVSYKLTNTMPWVRRAYGGTTDVATGWGLSGKASATFEAGLKINAADLAATHDLFDFASGQVQESRWRVRATGARTATQTEVQTFTTDATGGTFTLSFEGYTTTPLAWNITTADMQTALRLLPSMGLVTVAGAASPWAVTFAGVQAGLPQLLMQYNGASLTKAGAITSTLVRSTPGGLLKNLTIDGRVRFNVVGRSDRDGESIFAVQGIYVHDPAANSGLVSRLRVGLQHAVATLP